MQGGFTTNDLFSQVEIAAIPVYAGPPVDHKIVPIDVIGRSQVNDGDDVATMDANDASHLASIISAAGLSGAVSNGHIYVPEIAISLWVDYLP